jgi:putative selenium metabolism protein SsnA
MSLTLAGGTVVRSLEYREPNEVVDADVTIENGRITSVGASDRTGPTIDCSGCLVIPGNVCAHTHVYSALARGMPYRLEPPKDFLQILQRVWWRLDRALDEESIRASSLVAGIEALRSGTTSLVDHHASPNLIEGSLDVLATALESVGVRSVLCYEVTDRDGPERASAGIEENRRFLRAGPRPLTRGMVGAHASFTMSEDTLAGCVELARGSEAGIHIHVAEDQVDQLDAEARFGMPVVDRLGHAGALDDRALLAHCVHIHPSELQVLEESGATPVHNARSNMNNGVGYMSLWNDGRTALGTDGIGSDMFAEAQAAFWRGREYGASADPRWALDLLGHGAEFVGRVFGAPSLGTVAPDAPADLVVLDYAAPAPISSESFGGHWMFGLSSRNVRDVVAAGEIVMRDRRPTNVDEHEVAAKAAVAANRLWERMGAVAPHPFQPMGGT